MSEVVRQGVDRLCPTEHMREIPCDDPLVRTLVKEVARHGQAVIAYVEGTFVTVCCAVTRVVLLARDVGCLPFRWLGHCWGFAFHWALGNGGGGEVGIGKQKLLVNDDQSAVKGTDLRALEEGAITMEQTRTAPSSPSAQHQEGFRSLSGGNNCSVTVKVVSGHELIMTASRITASGDLPQSSVSHPSHPSTPSSGGAIEPKAGCGSGGNNQPEDVMMPFQLGDGEEEEASSFVPSSIAGSRVGRPLRWSMEYLRDNAEGGCGRIVATGNFGKVTVTTHRTSGLKMAVKSIALHKDETGSMMTMTQTLQSEQERMLFQNELIQTELKTLEAAASHPNVVDFFGYLRTSTSVLIMMPMINTDLAELMAKVGPLSEERAKHFMRQVISAVEYIHGKNILHRDLKPANLLLTEDETLLLADFGLAAIIPPGETVFFGSRCGTKAYMSPEQVESEEGLDYSLKVDTWGLGVIAYEFLHDDTPFRPVFGAEDVSNKVQDKAEGSAAGVSAQGEGLELKCVDSVDSQERANIISGTFACDDKLAPAEAKDFIGKLLERDVDQRLSARGAAEHPWLGGPDKALEIRTKAAEAVAARESEISAAKARLTQGRRRGVRRRVTAPVVRTEQGKDAVSGDTGA